MGRIQVENDPGRQNIICLDDKLIVFILNISVVFIEDETEH